jgi:hypothetical protein
MERKRSGRRPAEVREPIRKFIAAHKGERYILD